MQTGQGNEEHKQEELTMGTIVVKSGRKEISGKVVVGGFGVFLVLMAAMVAVFATGMVETLGYESRDLSGNGPTSTRSGYSWGLKTFYFTTGQDFFTEYETVIHKGSFVIHLYKIGSMPSSETPYHRMISQSGKGTVKFPIQESGLYRISFRGTVLGQQRNAGGYDLSYHIRWGIR
jgi:hypothetical protein